MYALLQKMTDSQVLIAAGLFTQSEQLTDGSYIKWVVYEAELKRRKLSWELAQRKAALFVKKTRYPKAGWKRRLIR